MIQLDLLGFVLAVITAIVGGAISIATNAPSRAKILRDLEILEKMSEFKTTKEEDAYLFALRASIGKQLKELVLPTKRYFAISILLLAVTIVAIMAIVYNVVPLETMASPPVIAVFVIISPFLGYALGAVLAAAMFKVAERNLRTADDFMKTVLDEAEDGMPEQGEDGAGADEPADEDSDVREEVIHR